MVYKERDGEGNLRTNQIILLKEGAADFYDPDKEWVSVRLTDNGDLVTEFFDSPAREGNCDYPEEVKADDNPLFEFQEKRLFRAQGFVFRNAAPGKEDRVSNFLYLTRYLPSLSHPGKCAYAYERSETRPSEKIEMAMLKNLPGERTSLERLLQKEIIELMNRNEELMRQIQHTRGSMFLNQLNQGQ
jgi:hypothetical protein